MTGQKDLVPYRLISCPSCGSLESRDRDSCSKCGSTLVRSHSASHKFTDTHRLLQRMGEILLGLALVVMGPLLMFLPFYPGSNLFLGTFLFGILLTVIGIPFGIYLLIFGDLPIRAAKPLPKYLAGGPFWRPQQSSEMIFGRTQTEKDPRRETSD
jgi:hypothetical protein